jgi:hypothetical protein
MPGPGVIGMTMGEKRAFHGAPRVNVKLSGGAIYPAICETKKCWFAHRSNIDQSWAEATLASARSPRTLREKNGV